MKKRQSLGDFSVQKLKNALEVLEFIGMNMTNDVLRKLINREIMYKETTNRMNKYKEK